MPSESSPLDKRLQAAESLLTRPRNLASGLALLAAAGALLVSLLLLASLLTMGPKAVAAPPVAAAPKADFQLSGSAFAESQSAPVLEAGSEDSR